MSIGGTTHHRRTLTHKHFNMKEGVRIAIGKIRPFQKHPNSLEPKLGHFHEYVLYTLLLLHSLHLDWHSFYTYVDTFADTYTHTHLHSYMLHILMCARMHTNNHTSSLSHKHKHSTFHLANFFFFCFLFSFERRRMTSMGKSWLGWMHRPHSHVINKKRKWFFLQKLHDWSLETIFLWMENNLRPSSSALDYIRS